MQTVWKGSISFGLVSIPVRLVAATEEKDVSFRQVHAADGGRIRYKRICDNGGHEVAYADIAKGYELPDGDMVVLTDEDLADLPISSSKVVEVQAFVPFEEIDPTALSRAYYAEPSGDAKPYVLFRDALEKAGRVAVVKVALRNRERLAVLRPREGVLVVQTMLWPDEVRQPDFKFLDDDIGVRPQEMRMAESYIDAMAEEFEPTEYVDDYREALLQVVEAKVEGAEITRPPEPEADEGKVVDLMEALRRSVAEAKAQRGEQEEKPAARAKKASSAKKAPAKKAAAKKTAAKRKSA
ncbi:MAG TPA: Ku protein [Jiangellaceae bacterium]|jgi:DNA end-binding protein Ku|nr:Ku protein [Jiangellaceae bacterium]